MNKYKKIYVCKGYRRDQHRLVYEEYIGRKLTRYEVVHHINGDKADNRLCNLQLMSLSEHSKLHFPNGHILTEEERLYLSQLYKGKAKPKLKKYTDEAVAEWKAMVCSGWKLREIERQCGINHATLSRILSGKTLCYEV